MSGAQIGGAIGAVVGFVWGGGNWQLGYAIGSAIGGAVDPTKVYGPKLTDAATQTSSVGVFCPFGYGAFPCRGNVIWQGKMSRRTHKDDGKGSGTEQVSYTYHRSYAIRVCAGPITGFLKIKRNGKTVYDARTDATIREEMERAGSLSELLIQKGIAEVRAMNAKWINNATLYYGDEEQLPDPTIEAAEGVGNVSPFRGRAYIVVNDDDVTDLRGAIPQYEFVVAGTADTTLGADASAYWSLSDRDSGTLGVTLTNSNRDAESYNGTVGEGNSYVGVRGQKARNAGRYYFEVELVRLTKDVEMGISKVGSELGATAADGYVSAGVGNPTHFRVGSYSSSHGNPIGDGDVIGVGVDLNTHKVWFTINGAELDNGIGGSLSDWSDPSGTHGETLEGGSWAPWVRLVTGSGETEADGSKARLRVNASELQYLNSAPGSYSPFLPWGECEGVALPDAPGWLVDESGLLCGAVADTLSPSAVPLSTIVADLCQRVGLTPDEYDVSQLSGILVAGFRIASEGDPASAIGALAAAYRFDCGEWDGKLRFVLRGGAPVLALGVDDLVDRDGDPIEWVRKQEAELLRKVSVAYMDPAADYTPTTQTWERRIATIQAKGEQSSEVPVVMPSDDAATIAEVRGLIAWAETESAKLSLPYRRTALTPTDVILITDTDGQEHRIRFDQVEEDSGVLLTEVTLDGGAIYGVTATGTRPPPRSIPETSVIGPTTLHVMDMPVWDRDANDELGVYIAARGVLGGWTGASVGVSTDVGATWVTAASVTVPSNIGYSTTALPACSSAEYPSVQSVTVYLPEAPATVTREAILSNRNRAALRNDSGAWEVVQYQAVADNGNNTYTLSGLVRGRYATTPGAAASGAAFVLLDETVQFVRMERAYLNQEVTVRAVSFGTLPENNASAALTITGQSQTEWPPHMVTATRDSGTNDVTVTWVERRRLGTDIAPYNSRYQSGFRVTYSDGQSFDVDPGTFTHIRSAAPIAQTITVQALNSITGAGQTSEAVTV